MKKDIEWLKEEMSSKSDFAFENIDNSDKRAGILRAYVEVDNLIDQLDKPEITEEQALRKITEKYPLTPNDIPWILDRYVANVLVEEPEKPVIPDYVAEYIETLQNGRYKLNYVLSSIYEAAVEYTTGEGFKWATYNTEMFIKAWINGYTVEEKKYKVFIGEAFEGTGLFLSKGTHDSTVTLGSNLAYFCHEDNNAETHLTEKEIKDFDERYFAFAVPVKETDK